MVGSAKTTTYIYDDLYRLTSEAATGDGNGNNGDIGYTLDKVGNRLSRTSSVSPVSTVVNQTYNARDWLSGDTYTPNGSTVYSSAFPQSLTPFADTYDFEERLILRTKPDGTTINISYDADGHRIAKNILNASAQPIASTTWLVDTNNLTGYAQVFEERITTPSGTTQHVYSYGTDLISQAISLNGGPATLNYFAYDGHGSTRELTTANGAVVDRYDYDAFGNLVFGSGTALNVFLYCGEQFDGDLGLYYLRARYLNPDSGRFWSMDGFEGMLEEPASLHKYLYAHANPVMFNDPSGNAISIVELMGVAGSKILDRMATINSVRYFRRVAGGLCKAAKTMLMPFNQFYSYVSKVSPFQRHHVFRNESMVVLFETYARPLGMAIALLGGTAHPGSPHDRATRYQNRVAKYNWPTEKVAYGALLAAGCSVSDAREIVKTVKNYNELKKWIP